MKAGCIYFGPKVPLKVSILEEEHGMMQLRLGMLGFIRRMSLELGTLLKLFLNLQLFPC